MQWLEWGTEHGNALGSAHGPWLGHALHQIGKGDVPVLILVHLVEEPVPAALRRVDLRPDHVLDEVRRERPHLRLARRRARAADALEVRAPHGVHRLLVLDRARSVGLVLRLQRRRRAGPHQLVPQRDHLALDGRLALHRLAPLLLLEREDRRRLRRRGRRVKGRPAHRGEAPRRLRRAEATAALGPGGRVERRRRGRLQRLGDQLDVLGVKGGALVAHAQRSIVAVQLEVRRVVAGDYRRERQHVGDGRGWSD